MNSAHNSANFDFNLGFWHLLKRSIMFHKDSTPLKEKVLVAKRILTPIIQDLMTDALVQTEIEKFCKYQQNKQIEDKNINILFNKVKSDDTGRLNESHSDNEWATKILNEINRDLDQPFVKVLHRVEENHKLPLEESPLNETLLEKLISVYQHLGEIIEHLKNRCGINKEKVCLHQSNNGDVRLNMSEFRVHSRITTEHEGKFANKNEDLRISQCSCKEFSRIFDERIEQEVMNCQCSYKDIYVLASHPKTFSKQVMRGTVCSSNSMICVRHSAKNDKHVTAKEYKSAATSVSERQLLERTQNQTGNKEIVLQCLESLDKVRTYLESLRNEDECNESPLSGLDNCTHDDCIKIECECLGLKQQEDIGNNHKSVNSYFVDGSSDIQVHPDTQKRENDPQLTEIKFGNVASRRSHSFKESRIPKLIHKKRANSTGNRSCSDMKIILRNGGDSQQKVMNLVVFNPDDPCKSIIKMKDHESVAAANSNAGVSKILKTSETKQRIIFLCQKNYGGKKETRRNPFWPGFLNLEATVYGQVGHSCFDRYVLLLLVKLSNVSVIYKIETVFSMNILIEDFSCRDFDTKHETILIVLLIYFDCGSSCFNNGYKKHRFMAMSALIYGIYWFPETLNCYKTSSALPSVREGHTSLIIPIRKSYHCTNLLIFNYSEKYITQYMKCLFRFMSSLKGNLIPEMYQYNQGNKNEQAYFINNTSPYFSHKIANIDDSFQKHSTNRNYHAYFFSCSVERPGKEELNSIVENNMQWDGLPTYPIWRIKKSKYYNLPIKKNGDPLTAQKMAEKTSKEDKIASATRSNTQMSTGSCADKLLESKLSENHNMWKKSEMKRKVSFRDDVDFLERGGCHRKGLEYGFNNAKGQHKDSLSTDSLDIYKSDDELADLLMTDSLMMIADSIPERDMKPNHSRNKELWENLELTNSAEDILSKLTRSFDYRDAERSSSFETKSGRTTSNFYDDKSNSSSAGVNLQEDKTMDDQVNKFGPTSLNSKSSLENNNYNKGEKHIRGSIATERKVTEQVKHIENETSDSAEIVRYYDYKAKLIKHLYDASGHKIETSGRDLTSEMFDQNGNLRTNLYTRNGERINAVYNSNGELLKTFSNLKLYTHTRTDNVKDISLLSKLFEENEVSNTKQNETIIDDGGCSKKYSDSGDCHLGRRFDHKKKSSTVIASKDLEKAIEIENKSNEKTLDSKDPEMTPILNGDETRKSEVSISWLNELLSASKVFARKKRDSIFRRKSKLRLLDLNVLYDVDGNIITHVYDCRGNLLAKSPSGKADTLIPFLFDSSGAFMEGRFVSEKNELKVVFDKNKNIIKSISLTTLNKLLNRVGEERNGDSSLRNERNNLRSEIDNEANNPQNLSESNPPVLEKKASRVEHAKQEKYIRQLFDEKGNLLTAIYDSKGKQLEISNPEFASNLSPYLFDSEGKQTNHYYDSGGHKLRAIYDEDGNVLKNMIISLTHLKKNQKCVNKRSNNKDMFTKIKNYSKIVDKIISLDDVSENTHEMGSDNNSNPNCNKHPNHQKFKWDKFKLSQNTPMTSEHRFSNPSSYNFEGKHLKSSSSVSVKRGENHKMYPHMQYDIKTGKSMHRFYDSIGNEIKGVYDYNGRAMIKTKSGDAEKLAPYIFDRNGLLYKNIYDEYGEQIKKIYDYKGRDIKRISVKPINSEHTIGKTRRKEEKRKQGSVYDGDGNLVTEICDRKGHPLVKTKSLNMEDLTPFIFHENGNRRRVYDKCGYEIGHLYDHKGSLLKYLPYVKQVKKKEVQHFGIFSRSGRKFNNFYDSEGTIIIALYDDDNKLICSIEKGQNNVKILSKFLFDEHGRFLKGKYLDFRGSRIKRVYDSNDNIIHSIIKTYPQKSNDERFEHVRGNKRVMKNMFSVSKINEDPGSISKQWQKVHYGRNGNKNTQSLANATSQSDIELKIRGSKLKRPISAYFLKEPQSQSEPPVRIFHSSSSVLIKLRKFPDKNSRPLIETHYSKGTVPSSSSRNSISDSRDIEDKSRKSILNNNRNLEVSENKGISKMKEKYRCYEIKKCSDTNVDKKVVDTARRHRSKSRNSIQGSLDDISVGSEGYNRHRHSTKKRHSVEHSDRNTKNNCKRSQCKTINHRKRIPFFTNLRDKILTVVFDNLNLNSKINNTSTRDDEKSQFFEKRKKNSEYIEKIISNYRFHKIVDITENKIKLHKNTKKRNDEDPERYSQEVNYNSNLGGHCYDTSDKLAKQCKSRIAFDRSEGMGPNTCNTCRSISTIYTNKKLVKKINDNKYPAKVDSDLIYLVSKQSLPGELDTLIEPVLTQMNYIPEETNYYGPDEFTIRTYSRKRTSECICQQCQSTGRNKNFIGQFGKDFLTRLSGLTLPFDKFFTRNILGKVSFKEEKDGTDSLEALINRAFANKNEPKIEHPQQKSRSSSCDKINYQVNDNLPISRKMIQETLTTCIHLNSSTDVVGKVSSMLIQHFTASIMQEIKHTFFNKLNALQCRKPTSEDSSIFDSDILKEDTCIGTELKFEDSHIGKHNTIQTEKQISDNRIHYRNKSTSTVRSSDYLEEMTSKCQCAHRRTFLCKLPNSEPFVFTMKTTAIISAQRIDQTEQ